MESTPSNLNPLFTTEPHGEHEVRLLEDANKADDRIYEIRDQYEEGAVIRLLGSELASLCQWWATEKDRVCSSNGPHEEDG